MSSVITNKNSDAYLSVFKASENSYKSGNIDNFKCVAQDINVPDLKNLAKQCLYFSICAHIDSNVIQTSKSGKDGKYMEDKLYFGDVIDHNKKNKSLNGKEKEKKPPQEVNMEVSEEHFLVINVPDLKSLAKQCLYFSICTHINSNIIQTSKSGKNRKCSEEKLHCGDVVDSDEKNKSLDGKEGEKKPPQEFNMEVSEEQFHAMKNESSRLKTFQRWSVDFIHPSKLAAIGLFSLNDGDKVQCAFCRGIITDWRIGDNPLQEHVRLFPLCPFLLNQEVGNIPVTGTNVNQQWQVENSHPECGRRRFRREIISFKARYTNMANMTRRMESFLNWPSSSVVEPEKLAEAGLFYAGDGDAVICFCCAGVLGQWETGDEPWVEHARHFPSCSFLKAAKGQSFIDEVVALRECNNDEHIEGMEQESVQQEAASIPEECCNSEHQQVVNFMKSALAIEALEIFSSPLIKSAVTKRFKENGSLCTNLQELCDAVLKLKATESNVKSPNLGEPSKLNSGVQDSRLCKICMDHEMGTVFLPCGHILACPKCAKAVFTCPLCRKKVSSTIRAYMS